MDDMSDAVAMMASGTAYVVTRSPTIFVGGRAVAAQAAPSKVWSPSTNIAVAGPWLNGTSIYLCLNPGGATASGASPGPTGTGSGIVDGGALWNFVAPAQATFKITASVQPLRGSELDRLPEELRTKENRMLFTDAQLRTAVAGGLPDTISIDGDLWQVSAVEAWDTLGGYRKTLITRFSR